MDRSKVDLWRRGDLVRELGLTKHEVTALVQAGVFVGFKIKNNGRKVFYRREAQAAIKAFRKKAEFNPQEDNAYTVEELQAAAGRLGAPQHPGEMRMVPIDRDRLVPMSAADVEEMVERNIPLVMFVATAYDTAKRGWHLRWVARCREIAI